MSSVCWRTLHNGRRGRGEPVEAISIFRGRRRRSVAGRGVTSTTGDLPPWNTARAPANPALPAAGRKVRRETREERDISGEALRRFVEPPPRPYASPRAAEPSPAPRPRDSPVPGTRGNKLVLPRRRQLFVSVCVSVWVSVSSLQAKVGAAQDGLCTL